MRDKEKANQLIPLFSINIGNLYKDKNIDSLKKNKIKYQLTIKDSPVILDFYIAGKEFDFEKYMNSMYYLNMFFSMDYLVANKGYPLFQSLIMQPIESFHIRGYKLFVRATKSQNMGNPYFVFYNNAKFYNAFLDRKMIYKNEDGSVSEAINMRHKEEELNSLDENGRKYDEEVSGILRSQRVMA